MVAVPFHPNREDLPMSLINTTVKPFKATAFQNGEFIEVTDASLKGKWSVLIFMPAAFTFNCPTEVEDAAANYGEFQAAGGGELFFGEEGFAELLKARSFIGVQPVEEG